MGGKFEALFLAGLGVRAVAGEHGFVGNPLVVRQIAAFDIVAREALIAIVVFVLTDAFPRVIFIEITLIMEAVSK